VSWSFQLSPEERHLVKIGDLDALEQIARKAGNEMEIAGAYERISEALSARGQTDPAIILDWSRRYISWARTFAERDGLPFLFTEWAKRTIEVAIAEERTDIARAVVDAILASYAPSEKERNWWMKLRHALTRQDST